MSDTLKRMAKDATKAFKGKVVKKIRYLADKELEHMMWYETGPVIEFTDGTWVMASQDHEGNGAGAFFTNEEGFENI